MRTGVLTLAVLAVLAGSARAQDPVRLPGVNVTATGDKPGPRVLAGFVVDTAGNGIEGAEVTVPELRRRMFTRRDGSFRFDSVRKGKFEMRARKIGYAAQVREFEVDSIGGYAHFALLPIVTGLQPMVSTATRRGLSGNVSDMAMQGVPDATVKVLGSGLTTTTDIRGDFFLPAETGRYMVSIAKDSFATKLVSIAIPKDSGRHVNAWLMAGGKIEKEHFWNIDDLRERQAWVKPQEKVLFTREDLIRMKIEWIGDAVLTTAPKFQSRLPYSSDCWAVINGGPEAAPMSVLTIDDVESVEVYRGLKGNPTAAAAAPQGTAPWGGPTANAPRAKGGNFVWIDNARIAAFENRTRTCPGIYVWLR
jgi:hypothetical protein